MSCAWVLLTVIKRTLVRIRDRNSTTLYTVFQVMDKSAPPFPLTSPGLNVSVNKETQGGEADIFTLADSVQGS